MTQASMHEWDARVAPRLQDLDFYSGSIARHARVVKTSAESLPIRPAWETKARESLAEAEKELQLALATVRAVKDAYDNLPVMREAAE